MFKICKSFSADIIDNKNGETTKRLCLYTQQLYTRLALIILNIYYVCISKCDNTYQYIIYYYEYIEKKPKSQRVTKTKVNPVLCQCHYMAHLFCVCIRSFIVHKCCV